MSAVRRKRTLRRVVGYGLLAVGGLFIGITGIVADGVMRAENSYS